MELNYCVLVTLLMFLSTTQARQTYFISSPNVIRVDVDETIVVNVFGSSLPDREIPVTVKLQDYPARTTTFDTQTVRVKKDQPVTITLRIQQEDVAERDVSNHGPQYVYLHAQSQPPSSFQFAEGTRVLLSYKAGTTFIQTDKPIYTPNQEVFIRLVTVDQQMRPSNEKVRVDIKTPQGIIIRRFDDITPESGFVNDLIYRFPRTPAFGNWTVVAYYGPTLRHNTSVQFLVKEYVLPTFSVSVEIPDQQPYILSSRERITVMVLGMYVFNEVVRGSYRIKYSLLNEVGGFDSIKDITGQLTEHGQGSDVISMPEILREQEFDDLIGKRLHIEAFVVEGATGKVESTNYTKLMFVDSPFRFRWDQTLKYFRVGMPFYIKFNVEDCYGDPVPGLSVRATSTCYNQNNIASPCEERPTTVTSELNGEVKVSLNIPRDIKRIDVNVETVAEGELANFQQIDEFQLQQFNGQGYNQLQIQAPPEIQARATTIDITLNRNTVNPNEVVNDVHIFTYVVAGGKIVSTNAQEITREATVYVASINITHAELVPSARLVSFYVNDANRVIADSVWVDVEDVCQNNVSIIIPPTTRPGYTFFEPGETIRLNLTAKPHTKIGLLAVDAAVYLLQDYHRLTKKKMFARMASYDLGCGPGGGSDTQDIFKNAGISFLTNAVLQTERRQDLSCADHNRKKRSSDVDYDIFELEAEYQGNATLIEYCNLGKQQMSWSCIQRTNRQKKRNGWDDDHPYIQAFYRCCLAINQASGRSDAGPQVPDRVITLEDYTDVSFRTNFKESWLFNSLVDMRNSTSKLYPVNLPSSITTWVIQAVGVSPLYGMCVADNKEIVARREVFLDVAIPYSVMRQEQVAIVATVYNYHHREQRVIVQMKGEEDLCSNAGPQAQDFETYQENVPSGRAHSFTFIVVPLKVKDFVISFYMFSSSQDDAVQKTLHVIPEGLPIVKSKSILLDPENIEQHLPPGTVRLTTPQAATLAPGLSGDIEYMPLNDGVFGSQTDVVTLQAPDNAVPDTTRCDITLIGSLLGPVLDVIIQGLNAEGFLNYYSGCGEQTMKYMAPNVYILEYLKSTDQLTDWIKQKASKHIEDGYNREVNLFRTDEGAFKTFGGSPGNSWLTAFVLRVFCHAKNFTFIDDNVICSGMQWLSSIQQRDGSFGFTQEVRYIDIGGVTDAIPLTAFVLIALTECDCGTMDTTSTGAKATLFLENKLQQIVISQDVHTLAITTYALALVKSSRISEFNAQLRRYAVDADLGQGSLYFPQSSGPLSVETTAYALLAQVQLGEMDYARSIVQWLLTQRDQIGAWYSTQDTMVALQALTQYASKQEITGDIDMTCLATSTDANFEQNWVVNAENALQLQTVQNDVPLGQLRFRTTGSGIATLSVKLSYNNATGDEDLCPFYLNVDPPVDMKPDPVPGGINDNDKPKKKIAIKICTKYKGEGQTNMGMIEVGMLSGFSPIKDNLEKIVEDIEIVKKYEVSDRSAILYLERIPAGEGVEPLCLTLQAQADFEVSNFQPAPVKVYDYYIPDKKCTKFYRPGEGSPLLEKICTGRVCECAAARCLNISSAEDVKASDILRDICNSNHQGFAYKVTLTRKEKKDTFVEYTTEVRSPLKKGFDDDLLQGQERLFLKSINCDEPVLEEDNDYLIVGTGGIPKKDGNGFRYLISSSYIIKHWPRSGTNEANSQFRAPEKKCKSECQVSDSNCKVECRKEYRPEELKLRQFFDDVIRVFIGGCQL